MAKLYEIKQEIIDLLVQSVDLDYINTALTSAFSNEFLSNLTVPIFRSSPKKYVTDIVVQLLNHGKLASGELALVRLLTTIKSDLGIEKQRRIEELIQAIDDELKPKKPLQVPTDIMVQRPPSIDMEGFQSVLFRRFDEIHNGRSVTERSFALPVDSVYTEWVRTENSSHILILILDFAADVQQNLLQISNKLETSHWIRGENLVNLDKSRTQEKTDSVNLSSLPTTHLFIDFSGVDSEAIFVDKNSDNGVDNRLYFNENLSNFCRWASLKGHRVVIGIPRFMLGFLKIEEFNQYNASTFVSAELYSQQYNYRIDYCQQLLDKSLPLKEVLFPLIKANSSALSKVVAQFLSDIPDDRFHKISFDEPSRTIVLIDLARKLTEKGFYEVAYRLELYCRTLERQHGLISLDADIHFASQPQDINKKIVGFIRGVEKTPAILKNGTLTGQWGVGKTTAFLQMEHFWSLPQLNTDRGNHNSWIPLFIVLGKEQSGNLWDEIRSQLKKNAYYWEEYGRGKRDQLACHALLSKIVSPANIRWLFNSPLYFLLDCIDLLLTDQKNKLEVELKALWDLYPKLGFLLAFRQGEGLDFNHLEFHRLGNVKIRNLNEYQIQEFWKQKNTPIALDNLLGINNKTICRYLHNPYILNIVCKLAFEASNLENLNLQQLLEIHININRVSNRITPEKAGEVTDEWLPQKALQMRVKKSSLPKLEDSQELDLITRARRLGILRVQSDKYVIQFTNKLLWDYFVAKQLFQLGKKRRNIKDILRENISNIGDISSWKLWIDILKILAGFLSGNQSKINGFIEFIDAECFNKNVEDVDKLNLVHECLQEIPDARKLRSLQPHFKQVEELIELNREKYAKELNREKYVKLNVEILNSLGFLDQRINLDDPLKNMIEVPRTELLPTFKIGQFPVTNMEFAKFVEDGGYSTREYWLGNSWQWLNDNNIKYPRYWHNEQFNQPNYPVVGVSFYEAFAYCLWLTNKYQRYFFYLPTGAEWDLVAHGPNSIFDELLQKLEEVDKQRPQRQSLLQRWFPTVIMLQKQLFGHDNLREIPNRSDRQKEDEIEDTKISKDLIAKVKEQMRPYQIQLEDEPVRPVGVFSPNEIGCFDLFGNVWQWCDTRSPDDVINFQYYQSESAEVSTSVIVKGGYWGNPLWTVMGGWFDPFVRFHRLGFRICCTKSQRRMFHG